MASTLIIASGGLDSTVAAYQAQASGEIVTLLAFNYGQRHIKEMDALSTIAEQVDAELLTVNMPDFGALIRGSSLTGTDTIPTGEYAGDTMASTVVPGRNLVMASIAGGIAASRGIPTVVMGIHGGDHYLYPDTTPVFLRTANDAIQEATGTSVRLLAPFINLSKADIVTIGATLNVPFGLTWSCYDGGDVHCGECGTSESFR